MALTNETTLPEDPGASVGEGNRAQPAFTLTVVWCRDEPWRIGERMFVPARPLYFGRGGGRSGEALRATFGQRRPDGFLPTAPLEVPSISRDQLSLVARGFERCQVNNLGRCPLFHNGLKVAKCEVLPGDLLRVGHQLLLLCGSWGLSSPLDAGAGMPFPFGQPDADGLVGESEAAWQLRQQIEFVAARADHVLIQGASGTGKELVARALHARSARAAGALVSRNAATIPDGLVDAELFGNAKNYPHPGLPQRPGLVGEAHGGSLFLDEFAELSLASQAHLLRVLDAGEYQPLGESQRRVSDFRLIAATNRELALLKPDVLARLALRVQVPDLNARREDIPLLVRHLLRTAAQRQDRAALAVFPHQNPAGEPRLALRFMEELLTTCYLTNVRQVLAAVWEELERGAFGRIRRSAAPAALAEPVAQSAVAPERPAPQGEQDELSPDTIQRALDEHNGRLERTWRALGLPSRFVLMRLIKRHKLEVRRQPGAR